jgi:hypothetical protein
MSNPGPGLFNRLDSQALLGNLETVAQGHVASE